VPSCCHRTWPCVGVVRVAPLPLLLLPPPFPPCTVCVRYPTRCLPKTTWCGSAGDQPRPWPPPSPCVCTASCSTRMQSAASLASTSPVGKPWCGVCVGVGAECAHAVVGAQGERARVVGDGATFRRPLASRVCVCVAQAEPKRVGQLAHPPALVFSPVSPRAALTVCVLHRSSKTRSCGRCSWGRTLTWS
jgi:hypothetical protein